MLFCLEPELPCLEDRVLHYQQTLASLASKVINKLVLSDGLLSLTKTEAQTYWMYT